MPRNGKWLPGQTPPSLVLTWWFDTRPRLLPDLTTFYWSRKCQLNQTVSDPLAGSRFWALDVGNQRFRVHFWTILVHFGCKPLKHRHFGDLPTFLPHQNLHPEPLDNRRSQAMVAKYDYPRQRTKDAVACRDTVEAAELSESRPSRPIARMNLHAIGQHRILAGFVLDRTPLDLVDLQTRIWRPLNLLPIVPRSERSFRKRRLSH